MLLKNESWIIDDILPLSCYHLHFSINTPSKYLRHFPRGLQAFTLYIPDFEPPSVEVNNNISNTKCLTIPFTIQLRIILSFILLSSFTFPSLHRSELSIAAGDLGSIIPNLVNLSVTNSLLDNFTITLDRQSLH